MQTNFASTILNYIRSYKKAGRFLAALVVVATLSGSLVVWRVQAHKDNQSSVPTRAIPREPAAIQMRRRMETSRVTTSG